MRKKYLTLDMSISSNSHLNVEKPASITAATDDLILDIKALVLLSNSQQILRKTVEERLSSSHDEDVTKFLSIVRSTHKASQAGYFLLALGQLILAAFLVIAGLASVAPALLGLTSPGELASYFDGIISAISSSGLSNPVIAFLNFAFAVALLLAGFYSLKVASSNLKDAGVVSGTRLQ